MTVIYADEEDGADERIERLIAAHSAPKALTVVSTDRRIRQAASRRKAQALTAEGFWQQLENTRGKTVAPPPTTSEEEARLHGLSTEDAAGWLETFHDVAIDPDTEESLGRGASSPPTKSSTGSREVDDEFRNRRVGPIHGGLAPRGRLW